MMRLDVGGDRRTVEGEVDGASGGHDRLRTSRSFRPSERSEREPESITTIAWMWHGFRKGESLVVMDSGSRGLRPLARNDGGGPITRPPAAGLVWPAARDRPPRR